MGQRSRRERVSRGVSISWQTSRGSMRRLAFYLLTRTPHDQTTCKRIPHASRVFSGANASTALQAGDADERVVALLVRAHASLEGDGREDLTLLPQRGRATCEPARLTARRAIGLLVSSGVSSPFVASWCGRCDTMVWVCGTGSECWRTVICARTLVGAARLAGAENADVEAAAIESMCVRPVVFDRTLPSILDALGFRIIFLSTLPVPSCREPRGDIATTMDPDAATGKKVINLVCVLCRRLRSIRFCIQGTLYRRHLSPL